MAHAPAGDAWMPPVGAAAAHRDRGRYRPALITVRDAGDLPPPPVPRAAYRRRRIGRAGVWLLPGYGLAALVATGPTAAAIPSATGPIAAVTGSTVTGPIATGWPG